MNDATEYLYACACEDDSVSVIIPNLRTTLKEEEFRSLHCLDILETMIKLHPIQVPALRESRENWIIKDNTIKDRAANDIPTVPDC